MNRRTFFCFTDLTEGFELKDVSDILEEKLIIDLNTYNVTKIRLNKRN